MTIDADLEGLATAPAADVLAWTFERYGDRAAVVTAFQAEGMAVVDLAHSIKPDVRVVTIDTGRLPQETYDLMDSVRARYGIDVEVIFPDATQVEAMVGRHGVNLFRRDKMLRELCCHVRKVVPLDRALAGLDAWITGLRRSQSEVRAHTPKVAVDPTHDGIIKVSPVADWSRDQVWEYLRANHVPTHELYGRGYSSIGCAPCTRAVAPGEDERAGRWWWETGADKECGIHGGSPDDRLEREITWLTKT